MISLAGVSASPSGYRLGFPIREMSPVLDSLKSIEPSSLRTARRLSRVAGSGDIGHRPYGSKFPRKHQIGV